MKKICVVTGSRAEYGLLYWLMKEIEEDREFQLQIVVTGMHLAPEFGCTYKEIEKEFKIDKKIEMLLSSDTSTGISKSMGLALISFAECYEELKPDAIVVLGDRYEILSAATAALIAQIPILHIHGGEVTEGAIDEAIRHSITKMSHLHFTSTEIYRKRVIQLGEQPNKVFNVGGMGVENILRLKLLSKSDLEKDLNFNFNKRNILVTYHPVTLEKDTYIEQFNYLLKALDQIPNLNIFFTKSNADKGGRIINEMIDNYVMENQLKSIAFTSLGQIRYLSALQFVDAVVGNSSSGLTEAPSFKIGTINIGDRQKGRIKAESVIDCLPIEEEILEAFKTLYSEEFQTKLKSVQNPYGQGYTSKKIMQIIKNTKLSLLLKKTFFDI